MGMRAMEAADNPLDYYMTIFFHVMKHLNPEYAGGACPWISGKLVEQVYWLRTRYVDAVLVAIFENLESLGMIERQGDMIRALNV
jgi:hypothetical protein